MRVSNRKHESASSFAKSALLCILGLLCGTAQVRAASPAIGDLEEQLIRAAYAKVGIYQLATEDDTDVGRDRLARLAARDPDAARRQFRIELRSVRTGPIVDILDRPYGEFVTRPSGDIPQVIPMGIKTNGERYFGVVAQWSRGQFATDDWGDLTVRDVLSRDRDWDIRKYTAYEVEVSFEGRSRRYRAMVVYHDPYASVEAPTIEYLDNIIGAGVLQAVWSDARPHLRQPKAQASNRIAGLIARDTADPDRGALERLFRATNFNSAGNCFVAYSGGACNAMTCGYPSSCQNTDSSPVSGRSNRFRMETLAACEPRQEPTIPGTFSSAEGVSTLLHINNAFGGGSHGMNATLNGHCSYNADCSRGCTSGGLPGFWENGPVVSSCHVAQPEMQKQDEFADSGSTVELRCARAVGVAWGLCDQCRCDQAVTMGLTIGGGGVGGSYTIAQINTNGFDKKTYIATFNCGKATKKRARKECKCGTSVAPKVSNHASVGTLAFDTICEDVPEGEFGYDTCEEAAAAEPDPTCDSCSTCNYNGVCEFGESSTCPDCAPATGCNYNFSCEPWRGENEWNCIDCLPSCIPCQGMTCGTDWLCGAAFCGNCFPGETCNSSNRCESTGVCDPCSNAFGNQCGWMWSSDCGRMADCGCPAPGETCVNGQCVYSGGGDPGDGLPDRWGCNCWGQTWDCTWSELISLWDAFCLEQGNQ